MNERFTMTNAQLELGFGALRVRPTLINRRRSSIRNPQWWFDRMRQIVDRALDWEPAPPPRPEQISFPAKDFSFWSV
jgi:hypothetical protein